MRKLLLIFFVAVSACSSSDDRRDSENAVAPCITEEVMREANMSEAEIKEFKDEEAKANREESCG